MNWTSPKDKIKAIRSKDDDTLEGEVIEEEKIEEDKEPEVKDTADKTIEELEAIVTPRHRKFCKFYASHEEVLGNGARSYAKAYNMEDKYETHYRSLKECASRLLRNVVLCQLIRHYIDIQISNEMIDKELGLLSLQKEDKKVQISAMAELNKVRGRITEKIEQHNTSGPVVLIIKQEEKPEETDQEKKDLKTEEKNI